jgi:superfamily II DNA or RNA helicase
MLGLSATPGERIDGFDPLTYWNVGQLVDIAERIPNLLQDEPFNTKILGIKYSGSPDYTLYKSNDHGMFDNNATLIQMMEDPHRLNLIVSILEFLNNESRHVYIFSDRLEYLNIIRRALFDKLRKSNNSTISNIDTLDEDLIKFMEDKPDYKTYFINLQNNINAQLVQENKLWQERLNQASTKEFYDNHYAEAIKWIKDNPELLKSTIWYVDAYRRSTNHGSYISILQSIAQQSLKEVYSFLNNSLKEESEPEYYTHLMETYKTNYIDQHIENKTTLSILTGGATGEQISTSSQKATMIFTTYGYMGTGKSIPKMDTILFVTPRRNGVEQVIGRVFRPGKNKNERWIIDIIDWKINLKSQWYERLDVYERQKSQNRNPNICETEISFTDLEGKKNILQTMHTIFKPLENPINKLKSNINDLVLDFSKLNIPETKNNETKIKKVRIIKKF